MHNSLDVANCIIPNSLELGQEINSLKLQKLLYYVHGHAYATIGHGAVKDYFEAWKHGPVIPHLYRHLPHDGNNITAIIEMGRPKLKSYDPTLAKVIRMVMEKYGVYDGGQLVDMCKRPGTPWSIIWETNEDLEQHARIPHALIEQYFIQKTAENSK